MIFDKISNIKNYKEIPTEVTDFILSLTPETYPGHYEISTDIYANIDCYTTKAEGEGKLESHKKYIDIQLLLDGKTSIRLVRTPTTTAKYSHLSSMPPKELRAPPANSAARPTWRSSPARLTASFTAPFISSGPRGARLSQAPSLSQTPSLNQALSLRPAPLFAPDCTNFAMRTLSLSSSVRLLQRSPRSQRCDYAGMSKMGSRCTGTA